MQVWDPFAQVRFLATRLLFIAFWATGGMSSPYRARTPGRYRSSPATYLEEETSFRGLDLINFGVEGFLEPFDVDRALAYLIMRSDGMISTHTATVDVVRYTVKQMPDLKRAIEQHVPKPTPEQLDGSDGNFFSTVEQVVEEMMTTAGRNFGRLVSVPSLQPGSIISLQDFEAKLDGGHHLKWFTQKLECLADKTTITQTVDITAPVQEALWFLHDKGSSLWITSRLKLLPGVLPISLCTLDLDSAIAFFNNFHERCLSERIRRTQLNVVARDFKRQHNDQLALRRSKFVIRRSANTIIKLFRSHSAIKPRPPAKMVAKKGTKSFPSPVSVISQSPSTSVQPRWNRPINSGGRPRSKSQTRSPSASASAGVVLDETMPDGSENCRQDARFFTRNKSPRFNSLSRSAFSNRRRGTLLQYEDAMRMASVVRACVSKTSFKSVNSFVASSSPPVVHTQRNDTSHLAPRDRFGGRFSHRPYHDDDDGFRPLKPRRLPFSELPFSERFGAVCMFVNNAAPPSDTLGPSEESPTAIHHDKPYAHSSVDETSGPPVTVSQFSPSSTWNDFGTVGLKPSDHPSFKTGQASYGETFDTGNGHISRAWWMDGHTPLVDSANDPAKFPDVARDNKPSTAVDSNDGDAIAKEETLAYTYADDDSRSSLFDCDLGQPVCGDSECEQDNVWDNDHLHICCGDGSSNAMSDHGDSGIDDSEIDHG